jgi:hypothetical protein
VPVKKLGTTLRCANTPQGHFSIPKKLLCAGQKDMDICSPARHAAQDHDPTQTDQHHPQHLSKTFIHDPVGQPRG